MYDEYSHVTDGLVYSPDNVAGPGCDEALFSSDLAGCDCTMDCTNDCSHLVTYGRNYEVGTIVKTGLHQPVLECNERCRCEPNRCNNRVVQWGPSRDLKVVEVSGEKGLGVITKTRLGMGQFVVCYAGEVLGIEVAQTRASRQTSDGAANYIIVVREHGGEKNSPVVTVVDPTVVGNLGRYINHSCNPNLVMVPVRTDCMVPHLALFASREVMPGEEVTFDYGGNSDIEESVKTGVEGENMDKRIKCLCKSDRCRGYLPFDPTLL